VSKTETRSTFLLVANATTSLVGIDREKTQLKRVPQVNAAQAERNAISYWNENLRREGDGV
jgi:hypothetical protein